MVLQCSLYVDNGATSSPGMARAKHMLSAYSTGGNCSVSAVVQHYHRVDGVNVHWGRHFLSLAPGLSRK